MSTPNLTPEQQARELIDERLRAAGWHVCDRNQIDLVNHTGVAVREVPMADGHGIVDYLLFVDRKPVGVLEAKDVIASQIVDELQAALAEIQAISDDLVELGVDPE